MVHLNLNVHFVCVGTELELLKDQGKALVCISPLHWPHTRTRGFPLEKAVVASQALHSQLLF